MEKRNDLLDKATTFFNESDRIDIHEPTTWIGKGVLLFARNNPTQAAYNFNIVLDREPNNIPSLFGKAIVEFNQRKYKEALRCFQTLLKLSPNMKPDPRVGVGFCFHRLNLLDQAKLAFERAVERVRFGSTNYAKCLGSQKCSRCGGARSYSFDGSEID